ncbi:uncharacterized protein LOC111861696 isoform X2 [Cryptotermes secundus]|nr:uncharacterized protein LOC111861696 isoform X2 [Cryptotermes secundus]
MVYNMVSSYGLPTRQKDVQQFLMLRGPTEHPITATAEKSRTSSTTTESTITVARPHIVQSDYTYHNVSTRSDLTDEGLEATSHHLSQALPYRYISLPEAGVTQEDTRFSNGNYGRFQETNPFTSDATRNTPPKRRQEGTSLDIPGKDNYPVYWLPYQTLRSDPLIESRIMGNTNYQIPRPFKARNLTNERPTHNRLKVFKNDPQTALPYYGFGSQNTYPQLTNYRYPNGAKNIQDIIKYLTSDDSNTPSSSNKNQEKTVFQAPRGYRRRFKFTGVYKTDVNKDSLEDYTKPQESMEDIKVSSHQNKMSDSSLNGHAYIADPFHAFKPSDPSEINLLANSDFRFAPFENRIRFVNNRPDGTRWGVLEINPNDKYFPRPPINFDKPSTTPSSLEPAMQTYPGTYTSVIYRPLGKEPATTPHPATKSPKPMKPFSVMLDIYPMMVNNVPQATVDPHKHMQMRPVVRHGHGFGQRVRFPHGDHQGRFPDPETDGESKHQMVVHLNLYPKRKKNNLNSRNDAVQSFHVDVKSTKYCCDGNPMETLRKIYEGVDNDGEEETLKVEYESEPNKEDGYKGQTPLKISEVVQPRGTISDENNFTPEVSKENVEDSQEQPNVFDETAPSADNSQELENTPIDIFLMPVANVSTRGSGIDDEFFEDSRDTKRSSEQLNLDIIPFFRRSQKLQLDGKSNSP